MSMQLSRKQIVDEAMTWLGTPFAHRAAVKGVGVDCAYLCGAVAVALGAIQKFNPPMYSLEWQFHARKEFAFEWIESCGATVKNGAPEAGDIVTFRYARVSCHLGIMINDKEFIHADRTIGRVLVNRLEGDYADRLTRVYQFPFLEEL